MSWIERIHGGYIHHRRVEVLSDHLAELIPPHAQVLDVGCGDGLVSKLTMQKAADVKMTGIDTLVRARTLIPVDPFDGQVIPHANASFDVVMFVDVLHHVEDPMILLGEAVRVGRQAILIKDHIEQGFLARSTLRFMDQVGNARHGVALPYNYWSRQRWLEAFNALGLTIDAWKQDLALYPWPARWIFERSLHFVARLGRPARKERADISRN